MRTLRKKNQGLAATQTLPCVKLKRLRERAGVTAKECAQARLIYLGKDPKKASPNSWYRYEGTEFMGERAIPDEIIEAVMPILIGKGMPPITADELLSISSAQRLLSVRASTSGDAHTNGRMLPQTVVAPVFTPEPSGQPLVVRYRAERGVYMSEEAVHSRTFGVAPITAAKDVKGEQFCVLVADGETAGTLLQCVAPSSYSADQMVGRRVVVIESAMQGLSEVRVGRVTGKEGNKLKTVDLEGRPLKGEIYGVVFGSYARE